MSVNPPLPASTIRFIYACLTNYLPITLRDLSMYPDWHASTVAIRSDYLVEMIGLDCTEASSITFILPHL